MKIKRLLLLAIALTLATPASAAPNDPYFDRQWGMRRIGAEAAWQKASGAGITIAIIDTGVDLQHEDLVGRFVDGKDYINEEPPQDEDGHGTHVAGIAAASSFNGRGVHGIAPSAKIMPIRVLNQFGLNIPISDPTQVTVDTADAIDWAVAHGADVINLSLGSVTGSGPGASMAAAIRRAWSRGVIVVVAAGNDSEASGYSNEPALVVVATGPDDKKASYSNTAGAAQWGISAPGGTSGSDRIYSTYYDAAFSPDSHDDYLYMSGTSMAAPHVSGAAALLRSLGLTHEETKDRLLSSAQDIGPAGKDSTFGHGRLDLAAAVAGLGGTSGSSGGTTGPSGGSRKSPAPKAPKSADPSVAGQPSPGEPLSVTPNPEPSSEGSVLGAGPSDPRDPGGINMVKVLGLLGALTSALAGAFVWWKRRASG